MRDEQIVREIHLLRNEGLSDTEVIDHILTLLGDVPENKGVNASSTKAER